ncbi:hypothetical protein BKA67DRAFT_567869 [Truncatella angustata]|uniref:Uncharacterized protein n=1 Tax=Truncatella angustata TaxID=152316 RepID=A0A9P8UIY5_9PEZI|nr:uncharacterized protein BKA67DRAFT_567869 [Truncatella angustata]KAH6652910.1 hypothetical protein BKA67DRAFT_567869 [Truncatella angustata]
MPGFVDWQTTHIGSAFHDLVHFVVGSLSATDRRDQEVAILDHYLHELAKNGGLSLSGEDNRNHFGI